MDEIGTKYIMFKFLSIAVFVCLMAFIYSVVDNGINSAIGCFLVIFSLTLAALNFNHRANELQIQLEESKNDETRD